MSKHKYLKETKEDKQFRRMLISMIGSIFLCVFCLVGTTWAMFETSFTSAENTLTIGEMKIEVISTKGGSSIKDEIVASEPNTYILREVGTYTIVLHNTGNISGYCTITITDALGETSSFTSGTLHPMGYDVTDTATITIEISAEDNYNGVLPISLHISPNWGNDPNSDVQDIDEDLFVPETEATEPTEATTAPTVPTDPTDPSDPTDPTDPADDETTPTTTEPTVPDSSEPTTPSTSEPTEPDSSEPTQPSTSEPTEPDGSEPTDPTKPTDPDPQGSDNTQPTDPTQPTDGAAPASEDPSEAPTEGDSEEPENNV